ncbi:hypothetical protein FA95DRAFT_1613348 [Auriscalpium vulgare]|uniref:Uncharacterized protein n=1 Tax=Auriscalpium vulgare TaxID=40419 RepID=A0ACB8R3P6_9AGAM|nr:hypothetical protein FA95DRAFT_1613348 [Auriscalpium vulgare]
MTRRHHVTVSTCRVVVTLLFSHTHWPNDLIRLAPAQHQCVSSVASARSESSRHPQHIGAGGIIGGSQLVMRTSKRKDVFAENFTSPHATPDPGQRPSHVWITHRPTPSGGSHLPGFAGCVGVRTSSACSRLPCLPPQPRHPALIIHSCSKTHPDPFSVPAAGSAARKPVHVIYETTSAVVRALKKLGPRRGRTTACLNDFEVLDMPEDVAGTDDVAMLRKMSARWCPMSPGAASGVHAPLRAEHDNSNLMRQFKLALEKRRTHGALPASTSSPSTPARSLFSLPYTAPALHFPHFPRDETAFKGCSV